MAERELLRLLVIWFTCIATTTIVLKYLDNLDTVCDDGIRQRKSGTTKLFPTQPHAMYVLARAGRLRGKLTAGRRSRAAFRRSTLYSLADTVQRVQRVRYA